MLRHVCVVTAAVSISLAAVGPCFAEQPLVRSARDGAWSAAGTWEGSKVPRAGDRVLVRAGHRVVYDVASDAVLRGVKVAGTLSFAPDRDTRLCVGLLKVEAGEGFVEDGFNCTVHAGKANPEGPRPTLEVGTDERPIGARHTAVIRLTYVEGMDKQSCPALVCCGGRMDLHGAALGRTWVKLGATAKAGDTAVTLAEAAGGWKAGDRIVVTGTAVHDARPGKESVAEERTVRAVDGVKVTLDRALEREHLGEGEYRAEVANLSRNVVVESADPAGPRGHTMYHKNSAGSLAYAEFRHLGKPGVLGRYSLHFHLCGDTMRGSRVVGNSIWDSGNRWLTIHGTNYLVVRDNVGHGCVGHGYFLEDGTEAYNVLDHNLAVGARAGRPLKGQVLPFDQNEGAGFWWANSLNAFTRNVAAECDRYGFRYEATPTSALKLVFPVLQPDGTRKEMEVRTLPFVRFEDNEVHSSHGLYGVNLGEGVARVGPDRGHPFVVRRLKIWDVHYAFRPQVPSLVVEGLTIHRAAYGVYHPNFDEHYYRGVTISQTHTEPFNRGHDDDSRQYGVLAVDGLTFDGCRSGGMPLVQISDDNPTGRAATHLRNVKLVRWVDGSRQKAMVNLGGGPRPQPRTEKGVPVVLHDWYGPGRHAQVASTRSPEYRKDPGAYRAEPPLTGDESRVREVSGVEFPRWPEVADDQPPMTVITGVRREGARLVVRATCADNGEVKRVVVNGREARPVPGCPGEWETVLEEVPGGTVRVQAHGEDGAGNVERRPHALLVR